MTVEQAIALARYDLCDVCGMDVWESKMHTCKSCLRYGWKTVACLPMSQRQWLLQIVIGSVPLACYTPASS